MPPVSARAKGRHLTPRRTPSGGHPPRRAAGAATPAQAVPAQGVLRRVLAGVAERLSERRKRGGKPAAIDPPLPGRCGVPPAPVESHPRNPVQL